MWGASLQSLVRVRAQLENQSSDLLACRISFILKVSWVSAPFLRQQLFHRDTWYRWQFWVGSCVEIGRGYGDSRVVFSKAYAATLTHYSRQLSERIRLEKFFHQVRKCRMSSRTTRNQKAWETVRNWHYVGHQILSHNIRNITPEPVELIINVRWWICRQYYCLCLLRSDARVTVRLRDRSRSDLRKVRVESVLGFGFWVLGFWVLGSGFWVLGSGFWGLGSGY